MPAPSDLRRYTENMEPSFMARPMSPLTLSLPDMKSTWPDCFPESMSSQSWAAICTVKCGFDAAPSRTVQAPSLMTACQVPTPSPLTSYWMVAVVPAALSARNLVGIASNVSFTVGIALPPFWLAGSGRPPCPPAWPAPGVPGRARSLAALEVGLALGEEGLDPLCRVLRVERPQERSDLDVEGLLDGRLQSLVDGLDDEASRHRGAPGELPGQGPGLGQGFPFPAHAVDEAEGQALGRWNLRPENQELQGLRPT